MGRRIISILITLFLFTGLYAQEDEDWFWDHPITKIEYEGLKTVKKSELTGIAGSFIGKNFTEETYNDILDRLYALDLFDDIEPFAKHDKNPENILLVFKVTERPVIAKVEFTGNQKIRNGELRELIKSKNGDIYVDSKLLIDERLIRDHYAEKGYVDSYVTHTVDIKDTGVFVTFEIKEGVNTVISEITFSGNTIVSDRVLRNKISLKEVGFMKDGAFQNSSLEKDKSTIIRYYNERGYADAQILDVRIDVSDNEEKQRQDMTIAFVIQEGSQYTFGGLKITGNEIFATDVLAEKMKLKPGAIFNSVKFEEGISEITNVYYESGYMTNGFYPVPSKDTDKKEISYNLVIDERSRSHVENILIKGNNRTKDFVITREIPLETGDVFSRDKLIAGLRNLYNLQFFSNIVPDVVGGSEENLVDVVFSVEEGSTITLNAGMSFSGVTEPNDIPVSVFLTLSNTNLFGEGKSVSTTVNVSKNQQILDFSYSQNWIGNLPIAFSQSLSFSHSKEYGQENMFQPDGLLNQDSYFFGYDSLSASLATSLGRRWTPRFAILSLTGGISNTLTRYNFDDKTVVPVDSAISMFANNFGLNNSLWGSFSVDNRDINYDPTKGWFASQRLSFYGLIPVVEKEFFVKSDTKLEGYLTLFDFTKSGKSTLKGVLAAYTGLTALFPINNSIISDSNKPFIDGMITGRGWGELYRASDAKGKIMWNTQLEFRIPIVPNTIGIDLFNDAVVVKPEVNDLFNNLSISDFYFSCGPGLKFLMPSFPLHFMFTYRYQIVDGKIKWGGKNEYNPYMFILSFNIVNR